MEVGSDASTNPDDPGTCLPVVLAGGAVALEGAGVALTPEREPVEVAVPPVAAASRTKRTVPTEVVDRTPGAGTCRREFTGFLPTIPTFVTAH